MGDPLGALRLMQNQAPTDSADSGAPDPLAALRAGVAPEPTIPPDRGYAPYGFGNQLSRAATMGWSDKAIAAVRALTDPGGFKKNYPGEWDKLQSQRAAYENAHPFLSPLAKTAGVVGTLPLAAMGGAEAEALPFLGRLALGGATGAAIGAEGAAGYAAPGQELDAAKHGAVPGAILGAAAPAVAPALSTLFGSKIPAADAAILKAMQKGGQTPEQVSQMAAQGTIQPTDVLADVLERPGQRLLRGARAVNPTASSIMDAGLDARQRAQFGAVNAAAQGALGVPQRDAGQLGQQLIEQMKERAQPAYRAAWAAHPEINDPVMNALIETPEMQPALAFGRHLQVQDAITQAIRDGEAPDIAAARADANAQQAMNWSAKRQAERRIRGVLAQAGITGDDADRMVTQSPILKAMPDGAPPSLHTLHYVKLALDAGVKDPSVLAGASGKATTTNASASGLASAFGQRLKSLAPEYAAAAQQYAGDKAAQDALEFGTTLFDRSATPAAIAGQLKEMSPSEIKLFRTGVLDAIRQRGANMGDMHNKVAALWGNPAIREKLQGIIPAKSLPEFEGQMRALGNQFATRSFLGGNSQTVDKAIDAASSMGVDPQTVALAAKAAVSGSPSIGVYAGSKWLTRMVEQIQAARMAPELAKRGMLMGPQEIGNYADVLQNLTKALRQRNAGVLPLAALGGRVGAQ